MASYSTEQAAREAFAIIRAELGNYPWKESGVDNWCSCLRLLKCTASWFPYAVRHPETILKLPRHVPHWTLLSNLDGAGYAGYVTDLWADPNYVPSCDYQILECISGDKL